MFRHVVAHVKVDRHTHQDLKLVFEAGDVEQGDFADHCWRNGGEQIEVTPFVIISSSGRAEESGLNEAIGLDQTSNPSFPRIASVGLIPFSLSHRRSSMPPANQHFGARLSGAQAAR